MRIFSLLALCLVISLFWSCDQKSALSTEKVGSALLDTLTVPYNGEVQLSKEDLSIKFTAVKDDRCPLNVNCIRAGEARATLAITKGAALKNIVMEVKGGCKRMDGSCGEKTYALGYNIQLIMISPLPIEPKDNKKTSAYSVQLIVSK